MKRKHILLIGAVILALVVGMVAFFPADNPPEVAPAENIGAQQTQQVQQPEETPSLPGESQTPLKEQSAQTHSEEEQQADIPEPEGEVLSTQPVSAEEPPPESVEGDGLKCTLSVRCDDVLDNMDTLADGKEHIIPSDGVIYKTQEVVFEQGESAFDVLLREMRENKIHLEFVNTPMFQSAYIEGIGNLYEFDCGDCSGWLYAVNGVQPTYGCSQYMLQNGDRVEFFYSCNWMDKTR